MKQFAVIGLGRFGRGVAQTLMQRGYTVLGIDRDRQIVQDLADVPNIVALKDSSGNGRAAHGLTTMGSFRRSWGH